VERQKNYTQLVCECELATQADVQHAIEAGNHSLDDIRREVRLGKGPCQAGFCTLRAAGFLHASQTVEKDTSSLATNSALLDFLEERWKGVRSVLWAQQLRQERLNELIYINLLNIRQLPKLEHFPLSAPSYTSATVPDANPNLSTPSKAQNIRRGTANQSHPTTDVIVIGAGLAGLFAAWRLAERGLKVKVISMGTGATHWSTGCIDILGYIQPDNVVVAMPRQAVQKIAAVHSEHPYALNTIEALEKAIRKLRELAETENYPLLGNLDQNWFLPTAAGTFRPTCLAPASMIAGNAGTSDQMLIVGFSQFLDFFASFVADNLQIQGVEARGISLDLPQLQTVHQVNAMALARWFDQANFREMFIQALKPHIKNAKRIGLPAVLGLRSAIEAHADLESKLGLPVFEIPGLPPSIPGIRLYNFLSKAIRKAGGQIFDGMQVNGGVEANGRLIAVQSESAVRTIDHAARYFILATGGILGGGIVTYADGRVSESALGLPIQAPPHRLGWTHPHFLIPGGQPIFQAGVKINTSSQPINEAGQVFYDNLFAIGGLMNGTNPLQELSLEGICLASAWTACENII